MKRRLALLVAALQVVLLAFMAGQREWILRTGAPLVLRTAPLDPDDPMRGAYVHLNYEIGFAPAVLCRGETAEWMKATDYRVQQSLRDQCVYAALTIDANGLIGLKSLSDAPPATGPFVRGRVQSVDQSGIRVRYGIEALFMHKAAALKMETTATNERAGAPLAVTVAVSPGGIAVLRDYAWEPLGLTIALDRPPAPATPAPAQRWQPQPLTGLTLTLHNYGDRDLAIVDLPGAQSFRMVPNTRSTGRYTWAGGSQSERPAPKSENVLVLKPGTIHQVHLDLTQPRWWVLDKDKPAAGPMPLSQVADGWASSFRIEYAPPEAAACRHLPSAKLIRHVPLQSRAFNANQGVD